MIGPATYREPKEPDGSSAGKTEEDPIYHPRDAPFSALHEAPSLPQSISLESVSIRMEHDRAQ